MKKFKNFIMEGNVSISIDNMKNSVERFIPVSKTKTSTKFISSVEFLIAALESKHIFNVDLDDHKYWITHGVDDAHGTLQRRYLNDYPDRQSPDHDENMSELYYSNSALNSGKAGLKKAKAAIVSSGESPLVNDFYKLFEAVIELSDLIKSLKPYIEKGRKPNPNAKPKFQAKANHAGAKMVVQKFEELTKKTYDRQVEGYVMFFEKILQTYVDNIRSGKWKSIKDNHNGQEVNLITKIIPDSWRVHGSIQFEPNYKKILRDMAERETKNIQLKFISKNVQKLSAIVGVKNNLKDIRIVNMVVNGPSISSSMVFSFTDKSQFTVINKIIWSWSKRGNEFHKLPTTFHDVTLADGKKMKSPSEEKMNTIFI